MTLNTHKGRFMGKRTQKITSYLKSDTILLKRHNNSLRIREMKSFSKLAIF